MSTIQIDCTDQVLTFENMPVISSGDVGSDSISFTFCSQWDGYARIAVFYQVTGQYYFSLLGNQDTCTIPAEAISAEGVTHIGVIGVNGTQRKTSNVLRYEIVEGAYTTIDDPSEDIYEQLLAQLLQIEGYIENLQGAELSLESRTTALELNQNIYNCINAKAIFYANKGADNTTVNLTSTVPTPASSNVISFTGVSVPSSFNSSAPLTTFTLDNTGYVIPSNVYVSDFLTQIYFRTSLPKIEFVVTMYYGNTAFTRHSRTGVIDVGGNSDIHMINIRSKLINPSGMQNGAINIKIFPLAPSDTTGNIDILAGVSVNGVPTHSTVELPFYRTAIT